MAFYAIEKRKNAKGDIRYKCRVREKFQGEIIHNESRTFSTKTLADAWGKKQVLKLESEKVSDRKESVSLGTLLNMYFENHDLWNKTGRTKQYVIKMLMDCDIANVQSDQLKVSDLIEHCSNRRDAGAGPATIYHDVAYLRSVMKEASPI